MNQFLQTIKNPIFQQYSLELLFPIVGYLFFDWSFLLIVLIYLVDQLGNQVNFFARLRFVQTLYLPKKKWLFPVTIFGFLFIFIVEMVVIFGLFYTYLYDCQTVFLYSELMDFLLQELWLFLPVLVLANYLKDKMTFYKTDLPYQESPEKMMALNSLKLVSVFLLIIIVLMFWYIFKPSSIWLILLIAGLKLLFDLAIFPFFKRHYFKKI